MASIWNYNAIKAPANETFRVPSALVVASSCRHGSALAGDSA
jgi:hypothetical protein